LTAVLHHRHEHHSGYITLTLLYCSLLTRLPLHRLLCATRLHPTPRRNSRREAARRRRHPPRQSEPIRVVALSRGPSPRVLRPRGARHLPVFPTVRAVGVELGERGRRSDWPCGRGAGHRDERVDCAARQPQQYCWYQAHRGTDVARGRRVSVRAGWGRGCAALTRVAGGQ
jgi:hypothetical protein